MVTEDQTHIAVRYESHDTAPGGSVWVQVQNRPYNYADEWECVWSTDPGSRGLRLSMMDPRFATHTEPAADIAIPVSWLPHPTVIEGSTVEQLSELPELPELPAPPLDPVIVQVAQ